MYPQSKYTRQKPIPIEQKSRKTGNHRDQNTETIPPPNLIKRAWPENPAWHLSKPLFHGRTSEQNMLEKNRYETRFLPKTETQTEFESVPLHTYITTVPLEAIYRARPLHFHNRKEKLEGEGAAYLRRYQPPIGYEQKEREKEREREREVVEGCDVCLSTRSALLVSIGGAPLFLIFSARRRAERERERGIRGPLLTS